MFWVHNSQWIVFSFIINTCSVALCMILTDSSSLSSVSIIFDLNAKLCTQDLECQVLAAPFVLRYFQDGGTGTSFGRCHSFNDLWSRAFFWVRSFTATEWSSCIASLNFETTRNQETPTLLRWPWICCYVIFVCLCFDRLGIAQILSRMLKENFQNICQNGQWK